MDENAQPEFVNRGDFKVAGVKRRGNNEKGELSALWEQFSARLDELRPAAVSNAAYGVIDNFDEEKGIYDYLAGVEVSSTDGLAEDIEVWELLAQNYAVFSTTLATLMDTIEYAYGTWIPNSNYRRAPGPEFEYYEEGFDPGSQDARFSLYIPVEPLSGGE